jgi:hypothetical protein
MTMVILMRLPEMKERSLVLKTTKDQTVFSRLPCAHNALLDPDLRDSWHYKIFTRNRTIM